MNRLAPLFAFLLVLCFSVSVQAQYEIEALPLFGEEEIDWVYFGDLNHSPDPEEFEDHGNFVFSVVSGPKAGLWEYDYVNGALLQYESIPSIVTVDSYYNPYGSMNRLIYYIYWEGDYSEVARYNVGGGYSRPYMQFEDHMVGVMATNWLYSGDVGVWGSKTKGRRYDANGDLLPQFKKGCVQLLLHPEDGLHHVAWNKVDGDVVHCTFWKNIYEPEESALVGTFALEDTEYPTLLIRTKGISPTPHEMNQPPTEDITLLTTIPNPQTGTEHVFVAGRFDFGFGYQYGIIYYDDLLEDWEIYTELPEIEGEFTVSTRIFDEEGNDALVIGGEIDMVAMGYPENYSGLWVVNLDGAFPLEEYLGDGFLNIDPENLPQYTFLGYDDHNKRMWAAGRYIHGKDSEGETIHTGFLMNIGDMEGNIFAPTTSSEEVFVGELSVTPNPSTGFFQIQLGNVEAERVDVYDITGKPVQTMKVGEGTQQVELNLLKEAPGIYLLHITTPEGVITEKVVKSATGA